jgi:hypothetical protein
MRRILRWVVERVRWMAWALRELVFPSDDEHADDEFWRRF